MANEMLLRIGAALNPSVGQPVLQAHLDRKQAEAEQLGESDRRKRAVKLGLALEVAKNPSKFPMSVRQAVSPILSDELGGTIDLTQPIEGPDAEFEFQSPEGKLSADLAEAEERFGADSIQARAIRDALLPKPAEEKPEFSLGDVRGIRQEFTKASQPFLDVARSFRKIRNAAENPSGPGDVALIFGFMKMLDPGSVVREGEFATAENSGGVPDRVRNMYNRIVSGERLNPVQRAEFVRQANLAMQAHIDEQARNEVIFRGIAERNQMNPLDVAPDFVADLRGGIKVKTIEELAQEFNVSADDIAATMQQESISLDEFEARMRERRR